MIDKILELLKPVSEKFSTKFLLGGGAIYALYMLATGGKLEGWHAAAGMALICLAYFFSRHRQERNNSEKKEKTDGNN